MVILVDAKVADARVNICKSCPELSKLYICKLCNCFVPSKAKFAASSCPAPSPKWMSVNDPGANPECCGE